MNAPLLADMLAEALQAPELACVTERDPDHPGRFYVYVDGSILLVDVHPIAIYPSRSAEVDA